MTIATGAEMDLRDGMHYELFAHAVLLFKSKSKQISITSCWCQIHKQICTYKNMTKLKIQKVTFWLKGSHLHRNCVVL